MIKTFARTTYFIFRHVETALFWPVEGWRWLYYRFCDWFDERHPGICAQCGIPPEEHQLREWNEEDD